eukprot:6960858-Prymnesium_polylepis.1
MHATAATLAQALSDRFTFFTHRFLTSLMPEALPGVRAARGPHPPATLPHPPALGHTPPPCNPRRRLAMGRP